MSEFQKTDRTTITRLAKRGMYDKETVYSILDEALFCTIAYAGENGPFQIPTGFCRVDDKIYIHGSVGSFYMREIITKKLTVSIGATLIDGIVLHVPLFIILLITGRLLSSVFRNWCRMNMNCTKRLKHLQKKCVPAAGMTFVSQIQKNGKQQWYYHSK